MVIFRSASITDLLPIQQVFYENEVLGLSDPPPIPESIHPELYHIFRTGKVFVAEQDGDILGYGAAITRGRVSYLTDLFVHPNKQSSQLGKGLLQHVFAPDNEHIRCTVSSTDVRAQALYIRSGMQPQWPHYNLRWDNTIRSQLPDRGVTIIEGDPSDPLFSQWDTRISGRERLEDHNFWIKEEQAIPLWFQQTGTTIGYGYACLGASNIWTPHYCMLGPIGAKTPQDAASCVFAAVNWAQERAKIIRIDVPGPHPCLAPLLNAQFRIVYIETFVSAASNPFFDARCYIVSGANLF